MTLYIITNHNIGDFLLVGPSEWRPRYFSNVISDELDRAINITAEDEEKVPYSIEKGIIVRKCEVVYEPFDFATQQHEGPYITYPDEKDKQLGVAIATYKAADKHPTLMVEELKQKVANRRWIKENSFIDVVVGEKTISIDASRSNREALVRKYIAMNDEDCVKWKIRNDQWIEFTKAELQSVIKGVDEYIQKLFDEENVIIESAKAAKNREEFKQLIEMHRLNEPVFRGMN